jgi:hemoglobin
MTSPDSHLPLTEPPGAHPPELSADEQLIRRLVDAFYTAIRADPELGPIFAANVSDWSLHLPKMYDFWSSMVLRTGRYSGRPIQAHLKLDGLTTAHFARWLNLWRKTVNEIVPASPPSTRAAFINAAERMAANMHGAIIGE